MDSTQYLTFPQAARTAPGNPAPVAPELEVPHHVMPSVDGRHGASSAHAVLSVVWSQF